MKLEYSILEHLSENDDGKFVDMTFFNEDYTSVKNSIDELKGKNLILVDTSDRDFEAFGIGNDRKKTIKAKIKMNGKIYFQSLKKINKMSSLSGRKNKWNLSYFFNF